MQNKRADVEVFARLASITDADVAAWSGTEQGAQENAFFADLTRVLSGPAVRQLLPQARQAVQKHKALGMTPRIAAQQTRSVFVHAARHHSRELVLGLLNGGEYTRRSSADITLRREGRSVTEAIVYPDTEHTLLLGKLRSLVLERPFPFGQCLVCRKVFAQARKGKARRYCSERCKAKGIASAAKRTEYMRAYRHRKRAAEIRFARQVLRASPRTAYARLSQRFRTKSRRELLYLLREARMQTGRDKDQRGGA